MRESSFISLIPSAPEGFEYRIPSKRDLYGGKVILYTDTLERCTGLVEDFFERVVGLVVIPGEELRYRPLGPDIWMLETTTDQHYDLKGLAGFFLAHIGPMSAFREKNRYLELELERSRREYDLARTAHTNHSQHLSWQVEILNKEIRSRKKAEAQLNIFKAFAESSQQGVGWIDENRNVAYVNPAGALLLSGEANCTILGEDIFDFYPDEGRVQLETEIIPFVRSHGAWQGELVIRRRNDGMLIPTQNSIFLIQDQQSEKYYIANIFVDIREQKKTEQRLIQAKKMDSIGILAGGIAHDFNNLLTSILGNLDLAATISDPADETYDLIAAAKKASLRAKSLTLQLLTFSKGGAPIKEATSIDAVIRESAAFLLHGRNVVCRYDIPGNLWPVEVDPGQISQVVQNLVMNAIDAMEGTGVLKISCRNEETQDSTLNTPKRFVEIRVTDQGCGIPPELLDKIFDPYFTTKDSGHGLGLSICHSIVARHEGSLSAESVIGKGTTFILRLPCIFKDLEERKENSMPQNKQTASPDKLRILIMDDEDMIRNISMRILTRLGHEVYLAADGAEAVKMYQEQMDQGTPPEMLIMDLTVPSGMGGKEAMKQILAIDPNAAAIVSSGYSSDPIMADYKEYGFSAAIAKPYEIAQIQAAILQAWESRHT